MLALNRYTLLLIAFVAAQLAFWSASHEIRPDTSVVPAPPSRSALQALVLGDSEFYFRARLLQLQNFGDSYGRSTSLRYYDLSRVYLWMTLLDTLNDRSRVLPSMAAYYFSQTQNKPDVRYMVDYLYAYAMRDAGERWWWLLQGIYLAMHRLNDMDLALKMAKPMLHKDVPVFAQQMVAIVHEKRGEMEAALDIMTAISENAEELSDADLRYMQYFVEERIGKLEEQHSPK